MPGILIDVERVLFAANTAHKRVALPAEFSRDSGGFAPVKLKAVIAACEWILDHKVGVRQEIALTQDELELIQGDLSF